MPTATVANIVSMGINIVEAFHEEGPIGVRELAQKRLMGPYQTIGCRFDIGQICALLEQIDKQMIFSLICID